MSMKYRVDILEVKRLIMRRAAINRTPLEQIQFTKGRKVLTVAAKDIEDWKFTGLNNIDLVDFILLKKQKVPR